MYVYIFLYKLFTGERDCCGACLGSQAAHRQSGGAQVGIPCHYLLENIFKLLFFFFSIFLYSRKYLFENIKINK